MKIERKYFPNVKQIAQLHHIINKSYLKSEVEFWKDGYERISINELTKLFENRSIFIATENEDLIGCVQLTKKNKSISFSMLCVDEQYRKKGVASLLLSEVERWAKEEKLNSIRLELLLPKDFLHKDKEMLKVWYKKLGFEPNSLANFSEYYPELIPLMKIDCSFEVWEKKL